MTVETNLYTESNKKKHRIFINTLSSPCFPKFLHIYKRKDRKIIQIKNIFKLREKDNKQSIQSDYTTETTSETTLSTRLDI